MKNKTYILNTLLAIVFAAVLLVAQLVRAFAPNIILPQLNIPNLVLVSLVTLLLDHYLAPNAKRCYICILPPPISKIAVGSSKILRKLSPFDATDL